MTAHRPTRFARLLALLTGRGPGDQQPRLVVVGPPLDEPVGRRSLAELSARVDQLLASPVDDCDLCAAERLTRIEEAILDRDGELSPEQRAGLDEVLERAASMLFPLPSPSPARPARARRRGRNDPCPCGSGRKYKRCHLDADAQAAASR